MVFSCCFSYFSPSGLGVIRKTVRNLLRISAGIDMGKKLHTLCSSTVLIVKLPQICRINSVPLLSAAVSPDVTTATCHLDQANKSNEEDDSKDWSGPGCSKSTCITCCQQLDSFTTYRAVVVRFHSVFSSFRCRRRDVFMLSSLFFQWAEYYFPGYVPTDDADD